MTKSATAVPAAGEVWRCMLSELVCSPVALCGLPELGLPLNLGPDPRHPTHRPSNVGLLLPPCP